MKRIIVDMMGGDNAPLEMIKGVVMATEELDAEYILVGDRDELIRVADENKISIDSFEIIHTPTVITMNDDPISVVRSKSNSSMSVGLRMLSEGKGDAFVSTGNTGALFTGANLIVRKIKGTRRPAIAALLPMSPPLLLLDSGANINVTPEYLEQFAVMGSIYMQKIMGVDKPRVGLLNNGSEEHKGTELQIQTYRLLMENPMINFIGNVEGSGVTKNDCDVLVTDGFTGNILLKSVEGMGALMLDTLRQLFTEDMISKLSYMMIRSNLGEIKKHFDASEYGGAPILGVKQPVIKAHGSSKAKAFKNAIRQALICCETDMNKDMADALAVLAEYRRKDFNSDGKAQNED